jgi:hypothetical protein
MPARPIFFGISCEKVGSIGVYIELTPNAGEEISASILSYCYPYGSVAPECCAERLTIRTDEKTKRAQIKCPPVSGKCIYKMTVEVECSITAQGELILHAACASLDKDEKLAREYRFFDMEIPGATFESLNHNVLQAVPDGAKHHPHATALCPNCLGNGSELTMKIPRSDWESGATGYELYSCNKVNGRQACEVCGGSGGEYLDWYLDEHPELVGQVYCPGNGLATEGACQS